MRTTLTAALVFLLCTPAWAEEAADERAVLNGTAPGSLAQPKPLELATLTQLCRSKSKAQRAVYRAQIPASGYSMNAYDADEGEWPIVLDRALQALDGAALLNASEKSEAFELAEADATALVERYSAKALSLEVTFRLVAAEEEELPACFTLAGSGQWALHVEALRYRLVDPSGAAVASLATTGLEQLEAWAKPGTAKVRIEARSLDGAVDSDKATALLDSARNAVESCTKDVVQSVFDPVSLAFEADVSAAGKIGNVRPQIVTAEMDDVVGCVAKSFDTVELPRVAKAYRMSLLVAIDRPGYELLD